MLIVNNMSILLSSKIHAFQKLNIITYILIIIVVI